MNTSAPPIRIEYDPKSGQFGAMVKRSIRYTSGQNDPLEAMVWNCQQMAKRLNKQITEFDQPTSPNPPTNPTEGMTESATIQFEDGKVTWDMFGDGGHVVVVVELAYHYTPNCFVAKIRNSQPWMPPFSSVLLSDTGEWKGFLGNSWL